MNRIEEINDKIGMLIKEKERIQEILTRRNTKRLLIMAEFMDDLPDHKLGMEWWASTKDKREIKLGRGEDYSLRKVSSFYNGHAGRYDMLSCDVKAKGLEAKGDYTLACKTIMCAAGWTVFMFPRQVRKDQEIVENAERILGLTRAESNWIFVSDVKIITRKEVANKFRMLAEGADPFCMGEA